ncbi:hypothetical protein VNO78_21975 [Psophocarpus tetragonolobus]|uniref:CDT1 Geminin-binding domain-containing protein n=1 Tax=Psophocarpus tetragonolobus TaxID=3891 RepID=A0AAN9SDK0_PSOTE
MNKSESSEAASPFSRSKKPNLRSSKARSPNPLHFTSKTPEKPPQRTRNRGVALSVDEIRKVGKRLQDRKQRSETASSSSPLSKSVRRQIQLWPSSPSPSKPYISDDESSKLPQKYEMLDEFFNRLDTLISMHHLKRWTPTFTSISARIESLTDRRFTHGHLAQLKFILPEAIVLKKHLVLDERTSCMKPDIHISLNPGAVDVDVDLPPQRGRVSLKKLFRARLKDFWESHPEGDDIPEGTLPEPFNCQKKESILDMLENRLPTKLSPCMSYNNVVKNEEFAKIDEKLPNMAPSFRAPFKQNEVDDVQQKSPLDSLQPLTFRASESSLRENSPHVKTSPPVLSSEAASATPVTPSKTIKYTENKDDEPLKSTEVLSTPAKLVSTPTRLSTEVLSTPAKLVSTPTRLMSATPALLSTKRLYMSPDDHSTRSLSKLARRPPRSRSLKFDTPLKENVVSEDNAGDLFIDNDILDILPENLIQSIRNKERMALEERDPAITQAKKRKKNIASLPKLFDMIRSLLPQRNCITKEELVSKIITSRCDIVDRSEIQEQLDLLQELAPEWISEKQVSSGDLLVFINKKLSPGTIRASLEEAV